jgi:hypothetical protein
MPDFLAYVHHHSIARSPALAMHGYSLAEAKRAATQRFGDGHQDHEIRIMTCDGEDLVATRRIGDARWQDRSG